MAKRVAKKKMVRKGICLPLLLITVVLTCLGLVMVLSSTYTGSLISFYKRTNILENPDALPYMKAFLTQLGVAVAGFIAIFFLSRMDYHFFAKPIVLISGLALCAILLPIVFLFPAKHDSHRWIEITSNLTFQPSEIAKYVGIFYVAHYTSRNKWWYRSWKQWLGILIPVGAMAALILAEPDLSTTMTFLGAVVVVMFISGMQWKMLFAGIAAIGALIPVMISIKGYQSKRLMAWLHAWDDPRNVGYQVVQSLYAIGDGGLFGVGLGNSKQKITHLPMSDTDYIFSIVCEEFGFVGALFVVGLFVAFAFFGIKVAIEAPDSFGSFLAAGITTLIVVQAFINMGVATNVLPSTGVTLPFISKGATSLGVVLVAVGVLLSVSAYKPRAGGAAKQDV